MWRRAAGPYGSAARLIPEYGWQLRVGMETIMALVAEGSLAILGMGSAWVSKR